MASDDGNGDRLVPPLLGRDVLAQNPYFRLLTDQLEPQPGADPYSYYWMDCTFDAVVVVPILPDGQVLVERIYRHPYQTYLYEFPAGGIDSDEDPAEAARRELAEETGYQADTITMLGSFEPLTGLANMRVHVALATDLKPGAERALEALELLEVVTCTPQQIDEWISQPPASNFLITPWLWYKHHAAQK